MQFVISMALGLGLGALIGPTKSFILLVGFCLVIAVIFVYSMGNVGVIWHYWQYRRSHFNFILHFIFPVGTTAVLIYSLIKSFSPFPSSPNNWSPFIVGLWMLLGVGILVMLRLRGGETWLEKAGAIIDDSTQTSEQEEATHET